MSKNLERTTTPYEMKLHRKSIKYRLPFERKNPNSLRFVIGLIIIAFHKGQELAAANYFRKFSGKYSSGISTRENKQMNLKALSEIINDKDYAAYWHLEAIASSIRIPTGAFLLLTRLYSILRDDKNSSSTGGAIAFSNSLLVFATEMQKLAQMGDITADDLQKIISSFSELHEFELVREQQNKEPGLFD